MYWYHIDNAKMLLVGSCKPCYKLMKQNIVPTGLVLFYRILSDNGITNVNKWINYGNVN